MPGSRVQPAEEMILGSYMVSPEEDAENLENEFSEKQMQTLTSISGMDWRGVQRCIHSTRTALHSSSNRYAHKHTHVTHSTQQSGAI